MDAPQTGSEVKGWVQTALEVIALLNTPAGIGLVVNLIMVQAIEAWDHVLPAWVLRPGTKDVNKAMAVTISVVPSMLCVMALTGFTREHAVYGMLGCIAGVIVSGLLDKIGWNLDRLFGQEEAK